MDAVLPALHLRPGASLHTHHVFAGDCLVVEYPVHKVSAQRKALTEVNVCFTLMVCFFTLMVCFFTLMVCFFTLMVCFFTLMVHDETDDTDGAR